MRKLLLATVAVLGGSIGVATVADAQTASPAPGTVTVRLNGRFRFYAYADSLSNLDNNASSTATGTVNSAGQGTSSGRSKLSTFGFGDYARLYPGFDGVAANGLKYGASMEIRQDNNSGAGGGVFGSISQQSRARGGLYLRREWGYIGTDQLGTIRLGATDGPSSLYMTGNFENFDGGGLNGDLNFFLPGNATITWPFGDVGNMYTTNKAIYLSPQLFGFDVGVAFEPNTGNVGEDNGSGCGAGGPQGVNFVNPAGNFTPAAGANGQSVAGVGCDQLSSTSSNAESGRRRNTMDALLRYRGTFGGFGIAATAGYIGSANVKDNQSGVGFNSDRTNGVGIRDNFAGLSVGDFGVAVTYAGFSVGGKYQYGQFNNQWSLLPRGLPEGEAWLAGFSYTAGPIVVGAHYLDYKSAGDIGNAFLGRQRRETGLAAGATYSVAPGVSFFLSGIAEQRKQSGFNFITGQGVSAVAVNGVGGPGGNPYSNKIISRVISLGTSFTW